jgi:hypothetical protein
MKVISGIYRLSYEEETVQYYVGLSIDIHKRYRRHCAELTRNTHCNTKLQSKHNTLHRVPVLEILEEVPDLQQLDSKEIAWILKLDTYHNGMNCTIGGEGTGFALVYAQGNNTQMLRTLQVLCTKYLVLLLLSQKITGYTKGTSVTYCGVWLNHIRVGL